MRRIRTGDTPLIAAGTLLCLLAACGGDGEVADLVLLGGNIVTVDEDHPRAQALAARDGRIVMVGSDEEVEALIGNATEVIELEGRTAIPGFIEGHGHFFGLGQMKLQLDLTQAKSWDEIVALVADAAEQSAPGAWIVGRGWHQSKWSAPPEPNVDGLPIHGTLSAATPANPVLLTHASGHASFVNAKALELAGIDERTPDPEGGEIVHDAAGRPIGMLRETAQRLVGRLRDGELDWNEGKRVVQLASEECLSKGVTSFQDAGSSFELIDFYKSLAADGALPLRLWVMVRASNEEMAEKLDAYRMVGYGDQHLTVRGIKKAIDGALGAHGAWLLEPYEDLPESSGLNTTPVAEIEAAAALAIEHDYQLCVHAIGDRANRETLDIFERAFDAAGVDGKTLRWRDEHAQHLSAEDIPRFAELGVIASMQAVHATSDGPWVPERIGERRAEEGAYVWRKLLDSGAVVTNGTDVPVEDVSPIASFSAAVTRRTWTGELFYPEQKMTREEALYAYTLGAAYAGFEEEIKGSLEVGKLADVTILDRDIMSVADDQLPPTRVLYTIVGGEVAYRAPDAARP